MKTPRSVGIFHSGETRFRPCQLRTPVLPNAMAHWHLLLDLGPSTSHQSRQNVLVIIYLTKSVGRSTPVRERGGCKRLPYHFCHGLQTNIAPLAVFGPEPFFQRLSTFAGIAGTTAKRDVLSGDYSSVIHDMFPTWAVSSTGIRQSELDAAIDTGPVPPDNLPLKRIRYVPTVHAFSSAAVPRCRVSAVFLQLRVGAHPLLTR